MLNGEPPASPPPASKRDERLEQAHGELRDALSAIRNLEQLLKSVRTGPRALKSVIPDVYASCAALRSSIDLLLGALRRHATENTAPAALERFVGPRVDELEQALSRAARQEMNAKNRLQLEVVLSRLWRELDAARELLQLVEEAVWGPRIRLDLLELVSETFKAHSVRNPEIRLIRARLVSSKMGIELTVNPRVAMSLFSIGINLVAADSKDRSPRVLVDLDETGSCGVTIDREPGAGEELVLPGRALIAPTIACAEAAAALTGGRVVRSAGNAVFSVSWSVPGGGQS
jgi:hypothetical protein